MKQHTNIVVIQCTKKSLPAVFQAASNVILYRRVTPQNKRRNVVDGSSSKAMRRKKNSDETNPTSCCSNANLRYILDNIRQTVGKFTM